MLNAENGMNANQRRLAWRCRRGLLELDLVLQELVAHAFNTLTLQDIAVLDGLLDLPDNDFWEMINGTRLLPADDARFGLIQKLKAVQLNVV